MSKVEIVDDSPILSHTMKTIIKEAGHEVVGEASNSEEAIEIFNKNKPDIVLLDILLPGESGLEVLKKLKSIDSNVNVLIVTAVNQDAVSEEAKNLGARGILTKPFDPKELLEIIDKILVSEKK